MVVESGTKTFNRIREQRQRAGLSQSELGRLIGFSEATVNRYENGNRKPDIIVLRKIALVLNIPLRDLFVDFSATGHGEG